MKWVRKEVIAAAILLAGGAVLPRTMAAQSDVHEIHMTAKKYDYSPNEIHVKQGETVRLLITALDRKHGFEIKELEVKMELGKGKETAIEFVAAKAGEFEFHCTVFCGFGHGRMKGKLIVEPAANSSPTN